MMIIFIYKNVSQTPYKFLLHSVFSLITWDINFVLLSRVKKHDLMIDDSRNMICLKIKMLQFLLRGKLKNV